MWTKSVFSALAIAALAASSAQANNRVPPGMGQPVAQPSGQILLGFDGAYNGQGMYVNHVHWGSIAQGMGLERNDVVIEVNGQRIYSYGHYLQLLQSSGGSIRLTVRNWRNGQLVYLYANVPTGGGACASCQGGPGY